MIVNFALIGVGAGLAFLIGMLVLAILIFVKKYIAIYPPMVFFVHLRRGKPIAQGEGGMVIRVPFFDKVLTIDKTVQQLNIDSEEVLSKEKQKISLRTVVQWQAIDAISTINNVKWHEIPKLIRAIIESVIRTTCAQLRVEEILEERQKIIDAIKKELLEITKDWGVAIITVEIPDVDVINAEFLKDMSRPREAEMKRKAELAEIERDQITQVKEVERQRTVKLQQIAMSKETGVNDQIKLRDIQENEKERELSVLEIEMKKRVLQKEYEKRQAEIEAEKIKNIRMKQAEAERYQKITGIAEAEAEKIRLVAESEAAKILKIAKAEAEGMRLKINALNEYTPQALKAELIKILPKIYENISIGDITLFSTDGNGKTDGDGGNSAYQLYGQVLLPTVLISKILGLNGEDTLTTILGNNVTEAMGGNGEKNKSGLKKHAIVPVPKSS
ncbi:MAG: SPFH domain-containing protein [Candidatus Helarchaeota archaeon]